MKIRIEPNDQPLSLSCRVRLQTGAERDALNKKLTKAKVWLMQKRAARARLLQAPYRRPRLRVV